MLPYLYAAAANLAAIGQSLDAAASNEQFANGPRVNEQLGRRVADAAKWVDQSREVARALMNGITYPPQALTDPLAAAKAFIEQFAEQSIEPPGGPAVAAGARQSASPRIDWQWGDGASPLADQLPAVTAIAIYRLTSEFVRNAIRHANASSIDVSATLVDGAAVVMIDDDGRGFDPRDVDTSSSHGLALAHHRAAGAGVQLAIESSQESDRPVTSGTRVTLRAAVPPKTAPQTQAQPSPDEPSPPIAPTPQVPR